MLAADSVLFDVEARLRGWCLMVAGQERGQLQRSLIYTIYVEGIAEWQTEIEGCRLCADDAEVMFEDRMMLRKDIVEGGWGG